MMVVWWEWHKVKSVSEILMNSRAVFPQLTVAQLVWRPVICCAGAWSVCVAHNPRWPHSAILPVRYSSSITACCVYSLLVVYRERLTLVPFMPVILPQSTQNTALLQSPSCEFSSFSGRISPINSQLKERCILCTSRQTNTFMARWMAYTATPPQKKRNLEQLPNH